MTQSRSPIVVAPLRKAILMRVSLLITATVMLVAAGFFVFGMRPMIERIAQSQFNVAAARVEASLNAMFAPAGNLLDMSRGWIGGEAPDLEDPTAFNRIFQPVLKALPQVTSVVAGTSTGQGWLLLEQGGGRWRNRMTDVPRFGKRQLFFDHLPDGSVKSEWREVDYDPRLRPWYLAALKSPAGGEVRWTAPYVLFTTGDPGITASLRVRLRDGRDFAIGFDLMLRDLSQSTMGALVGKTGLALVLTDDERVLSLPAVPGSNTPSDWLKKILRPAPELGLAPVTDALAVWRRNGRNGHDVLSYPSAGARWLASIRPYSLGEQRLWVVVLAPADDFEPSWVVLLGALAGGLVLLLCLAILLIRAYSQRIARPLEQLAAASKRIGQLDFDASVAVESPIAEISQLAEAQDGMRGLLQRNQRELATQAETLSGQITALRAAEIRLRESEAYNKVLFVDSRIPLVVLDPDSGRFVDCNAAAVAIYRLDNRDAVLGRSVIDVSAPAQYDGSDSVAAAQMHIERAMREGSHVFEWRHRYTDGREWDAEVHLMTFRHGGRTLLQFGLQDITQRKAAAGEIAQLAFYDTLTSLPNRRLLSDRLQQSLATSLRTSRKGALLFIDLDNFKTLNDTLGHDQGDRLLQQVALRLVTCVRESDTVGRFGGDEFLVILEDLSDDPLEAARHTEGVGEKILAVLNRPYDLSGREHYSTPSIGVTLFAEPGDNVDELLKRADLAMYQAKGAGRNALRFFDPEIQTMVAARAAMEEELRQAVPRGELVLHYQVQVNVAGRPIGAEALVRWNHPSRGLVLPGEFIALAEATGLIQPLGQWVLEEACRQLVAWADQPHKAHWILGINVSSRQFRHPAFVEQVVAVLEKTGANPLKLKLELTESLLLEDVENVVLKMTALRARGLSFSLDDFGTGYSSLSYLKRLPLDQLKIDQSFVRDVLTDANDAAIARTIIALAQILGLTVMAEGVETEAQRDFLTRQGCQAYQGYLFGRPGPADLLNY
ncbi:MAG: EAL domain-containing protein [Betaproteobacteria bacterium]